MQRPHCEQVVHNGVLECENPIVNKLFTMGLRMQRPHKCELFCSHLWGLSLMMNEI